MAKLRSLAVAAAVAAASADWTILSKDVGTICTGIDFVSASRGYIPVSQNGVGTSILTTTDGGKSWAPASSEPFALLLLDITAYSSFVAVVGALTLEYSWNSGEYKAGMRKKSPAAQATSPGCRLLACTFSGPARLAHNNFSVSAVTVQLFARKRGRRSHWAGRRPRAGPSLRLEEVPKKVPRRSRGHAGVFAPPRAGSRGPLRRHPPILKRARAVAAPARRRGGRATEMRRSSA
jgi:hypothetical protein